MLCPLLCYAAHWVLVAHSSFAETHACKEEEEANPEQGVSICHWFRCHTGPEVDGSG